MKLGLTGRLGLWCCLRFAVGVTVRVVVEFTVEITVSLMLHTVTGEVMVWIDATTMVDYTVAVSVTIVLFFFP